MQKNHHAVLDTEENAIDIRVNSRSNFVEPVAKPIDKRLSNGPPPLDLLDVGPDLSTHVGWQPFQPLSDGLVSSLRLVEMARERRALGGSSHGSFQGMYRFRYASQAQKSADARIDAYASERVHAPARKLHPGASRRTPSPRRHGWTTEAASESYTRHHETALPSMHRAQEGMMNEDKATAWNALHNKPMLLTACLLRAQRCRALAARTAAADWHVGLARNSRLIGDPQLTKATCMKRWTDTHRGIRGQDKHLYDRIVASVRSPAAGALPTPDVPGGQPWHDACAQVSE